MAEQDSPKVAIVATVYGHIESFHLPAIKLLHKLGYEVHAYAGLDHGKAGVEQAGARCHDLPIRRSPFARENLRALRMLVDSFKVERFRMVHVHTPVGGIIGRLAAKRTRVPTVIYTAHGFHFYRGAPLLNWLLYYPVEWWTARYTDYLITINQEDYRRAMRLPVSREVAYIPGVGLEVDQYQLAESMLIRDSIRNQLGISQDAYVIICIAELNRNKNQGQLIEALSLMSKSTSTVHCLLVGNGEGEANLRALVEKYGLTEQVHFLGYRRDIPQLLAAADVCVLTSKREGLPRAIMEAMAAGKPIVGTKIRGIKDLVIEGENGFLVAVGDVRETFRSLELLHQNRELREQMGRKSKELASQYALKAIMEKVEGIYLSGDGLGYGH